MRNRIWLGMVVAVSLAMALPYSAFAQDNDGCSQATLDGDYAFTVSGEIFSPTGALVDTRAGVAMTRFDGAGNLTQNDYIVSSAVYAASKTNNGHVPGPPDPITGFNTNETGTYNVFPDCTGTMEIDFPTPPGDSSGAVIKLRIVLADGGRTIDTVVTSLTPPQLTGATTPLPPLNAIIRSEGEKLVALPAVQFPWNSPNRER